MRKTKISKNEMNYLKDDGTYLLDTHVYLCFDFCDGFGIVQYDDETENFVDTNSKLLLKTNVIDSSPFYNGFAEIYISINDCYYIDKECNFYTYEDKVSFKVLYNEYPNKRSELIEIIKNYTYFDANEYFNI